jgi:hypothetical protein
LVINYKVNNVTLTSSQTLIFMIHVSCTCCMGNCIMVQWLACSLACWKHGFEPSAWSNWKSNSNNMLHQKVNGPYFMCSLDNLNEWMCPRSPWLSHWNISSCVDVSLHNDMDSLSWFLFSMQKLAYKKICTSTTYLEKLIMWHSHRA